MTPQPPATGKKDDMTITRQEAVRLARIAIQEAKIAGQRVRFGDEYAEIMASDAITALETAGLLHWPE